MKYKITHSYNWYQTNYESFIIKTYYINDVPFTFDDGIGIHSKLKISRPYGIGGPSPPQSIN